MDEFIYGAYLIREWHTSGDSESIYEQDLHYDSPLWIYDVQQEA